jgi:hypothetical protein
MIHYIDKDTLLKEIEKLKCNLCPDFYEYNYEAVEAELLEKIEILIDSLEVKEIDLEKELRDFVVGDIDDYDMGLAKHFFELGMRVNNPITAADRGIADEIIFALNTLGKEKMISYDKEIAWVKKLIQEVK